MGYAMCVGNCGCCGRIFMFNPTYVPSKNNIPYCQDCIEQANVVRKERNLPALMIHPEAYEPCGEGEFH
jgi:hypothetical protein